MQNEKYQGSVHILGSDIFSKELPYYVNENSDSFEDGYMGFQLKDQINRVDTIYSKMDTVNFSGNNFEGFNIVITSIEDNIFRADFEGIIRTKSEKSREKVIRNGRLKITMEIVTEQ